MAEHLRSSTVTGFLISVMLIFILYIMLLPQGQRDSLLKEGKLIEDKTSSANGTLPEGVLYQATSVHMDVVKHPTEEHKFPNVVLTDAKKAVVLSKQNPFEIYNGWFTSKTKEIQFFVQNPELVDSVHITFQAPVKKGVLKITVNGAIIYDSRVSGITPVIVPLEILQKSNIIELEATGGFFETKEFQMNEFNVIAYVKDLAKLRTTYTFSVGNEEYNQLETSQLQFYAACSQQSTGVMTIMLNNRIVSQAIPACDSPNVIDVFKDDLLPGRNALTITLDSGSAEIQLPALKTGSENATPIIGYYNIDEDKYYDILDDEIHIKTTIKFVDDGEHKQGVLTVNGIKYAIDQYKPEYEADISKDTILGNNYLTLTPDTTLDIVDMRVWED